MRFVLLLVLAVALSAIIVPDASALRFADTPCAEAGAGGIRICPAGRAGAPYAIKLEGAGGCGPSLPYEFSVLNGSLPPGLLLREDGLLEGVPTHAGRWSFWIGISDQDPPSASWCRPTKSEREFTVFVGAAPAEVRAPYSLAVGAAGYGPQTWSIASGQLPFGLALDSTTGVITGTPEVAGSFPITFSAVDSKGQTQAVELTITVSPELAFATTQLALVRVGRPYRATVRTRGGVSPVKLKALSGRFPVGIRLNVNTGVLSGKPRKAGVFRITIEARDALGRTAVRTFVLTVRRPGA